MVFEGRNKAYGAYKLREQTGARYRRVLIIVLGTLGALLGAQGSLALYAHIMAVRGMKEAEMREIGGMIVQLLRGGSEATDEVRRHTIELCRRFPLYPEL